MPRARNAIASTATRTPRIVTTRTPLFDEAGWREDGTDLGEMRSDIFLTRNLDGPNRFEMAGEIRFCAQRVLALFLEARPCDRGPKRSLICPGITFQPRTAPQFQTLLRPDLSQSVISSSSRASFLVFASDISIQTFSPKALR
jgi:hypothetical protein